MLPRAAVYSPLEHPAHSSELGFAANLPNLQVLPQDLGATGNEEKEIDMTTLMKEIRGINSTMQVGLFELFEVA